MGYKSVLINNYSLGHGVEKRRLNLRSERGLCLFPSVKVSLSPPIEIEKSTCRFPFGSCARMKREKEREREIRGRGGETTTKGKN